MLFLKAVPRHCPLVASLWQVENLSHWRITVAVFGLKSLPFGKRKNAINFFHSNILKTPKKKKMFAVTVFLLLPYMLSYS